jgi:hypothetical protein
MLMHGVEARGFDRLDLEHARVSLETEQRQQQSLDGTCEWHRYGERRDDDKAWRQPGGCLGLEGLLETHTGCHRLPSPGRVIAV